MDCLACMEEIKVRSVYQCGHHVLCHQCCLKQRVLYENECCVMCKQPSSQVVFAMEEGQPQQTWERAASACQEVPSRRGCLTSDSRVSDMLRDLFVARCLECGLVCKSQALLSRHVTRNHQLYMCPTCLKHRRVFLHEQPLMTKEELRKHIKEGDDELRLPPHPLCRFCNNHHMDDEALFSHMRLKHHECQVCVNNGVRHQFYAEFSSLQAHWRKHKSTHHFCPFGCPVAVFPDELGLRQHKLQYHLRQLSKAQIKALSKLDDVIQVKMVSAAPSSSSSSSSRSNSRSTSSSRDAAPAPPSPRSLLRPKIAARLPVPPNNTIVARQRNSEVLEALRSVAGEATVAQFRTSALALRDGNMSCQAYFDSFINIFGAETAESVLPALISLLPREDLRSELEDIYVEFVVERTMEERERAEREAREASRPRVETGLKCAECKQTLPRELFSRSQQKKGSQRQCRDCTESKRSRRTAAPKQPSAHPPGFDVALPEPVFQIREAVPLEDREKQKRLQAERTTQLAKQKSKQRSREANEAKEAAKRAEAERKQRKQEEDEANRLKKLEAKKERKRKEKERRRKEYEAAQEAQKQERLRKAVGASSIPLHTERVSRPAQQGVPWSSSASSQRQRNVWGTEEFPSLPDAPRRDPSPEPQRPAAKNGKKKKKGKNKEVLFRIG